MEIDGFLIQRIAFVGVPGGNEVDHDTEDGEQNHAIVIDRSGLEDALDSAVNDNTGTSEKDKRSNKAADDGVADVAVSVFVVGGFATIALKEVGDTDTESVAEIVNGVGSDGDTICEEAADKLENRKAEIEEESDEDFMSGSGLLRAGGLRWALCFLSFMMILCLIMSF